MSDYDKKTLNLILGAIFNLFAAALNVIVVVNAPNPFNFVFIIINSIAAGCLIALAIERHT